MEKKLKEKIEQWLQKARNDIITAEHESERSDQVTDTICFHAQQAVEKYLKLFLIFHGNEPEKTHSISFLLEKCRKINPLFSNLEDVAYLSDYAVSLRYPDNFYIPGADEAKKALENAKKVNDLVLSLINPLLK